MYAGYNSYKIYNICIEMKENKSKIAKKYKIYEKKLVFQTKNL